jgi:hypothetical protein
MTLLCFIEVEESNQSFHKTISMNLTTFKLHLNFLRYLALNFYWISYWALQYDTLKYPTKINNLN